MREERGWEKVRVLREASGWWDNRLGELCSNVRVLYTVLIGSFPVYV